MRYLILIYFGLFSVQLSFAQDTCPCCSENHRAFDFWVGKWNVTNPDGSYAGTNSITKVEGECVIREQWTSATPGYTGTSMNYYDAVLQQWVQLWVDSQGQSLYMRGGLVNDAMVLTSELLLGSDGIERYNRVTWSLMQNGKVRQHWEVSTDGSNWTTAFDGLYSPI